MFGKRAESLSPYLKKGNLHAFYLRDLFVEEYTGKDGSNRVALKATIDDVELCGNKDGGVSDNKTPPKQTATNFDDMDDNQIPF